jgi:hypothetical protein
MFQLVFSPSHGMSTHFTPSLLYQTQIISHPLMSTIGPLPSHPHVSCLACGCLFITNVRLACHQLTCFVHKQLLTIGLHFFQHYQIPTLFYLDMGSHLLISSMFSIYVYYTPIHIIIFHIFHINVHHALCIPLIHMNIDPFGIATWHTFFSFHSWCFPPQNGKKGQ